MTNTKIRPLAAALACGAVLLTACGDSSLTSSALAQVPGTGVPVAATTSSSAAISFIGTVVASAETADAVELGDVVLATSETDEPDPSV